MGRKPVPREIVQLRISPEEFEDLNLAATNSGRSVPEEIRNRLAEYRSVGIDRALVDLVTIITARANDALVRYPLAEGQDHRGQLLGVVRDAMAVVLNDLGAADTSALGDKDFPIAKGITWDLITKIKSSRSNPGGWVETPEDRAIERIARAFGYHDGTVTVEEEIRLLASRKAKGTSKEAANRKGRAKK